MSLFDSTTTIKFEPAYYEAMARNTAALTALVLAVTTAERNINMKLDEALEAIAAEGAKQTEAVGVLTTEVAKIPESIDALEQQLRDAVGGELSLEAQAKVDAALGAFRGNTQVITDAAATVKAGTDDAGDGTGT